MQGLLMRLKKMSIPSAYKSSSSSTTSSCSISPICEGDSKLDEPLDTTDLEMPTPDSIANERASTKRAFFEEDSAEAFPSFPSKAARIDVGDENMGKRAFERFENVVKTSSTHRNVADLDGEFITNT
jgi:hypothetical protein